MKLIPYHWSTINLIMNFQNRLQDLELTQM